MKKIRKIRILDLWWQLVIRPTCGSYDGIIGFNSRQLQATDMLLAYTLRTLKSDIRKLFFWSLYTILRARVVRIDKFQTKFKKYYSLNTIVYTLNQKSEFNVIITLDVFFDFVHETYIIVHFNNVLGCWTYAVHFFANYINVYLFTVQLFSPLSFVLRLYTFLKFKTRIRLMKSERDNTLCCVMRQG